MVPLYICRMCQGRVQCLLPFTLPDPDELNQYSEKLLTFGMKVVKVENLVPLQQTQHHSP
jgi:hypothetical protein